MGYVNNPGVTLGVSGESGKALKADDPALLNVTSVINPKNFGAKGDTVRLTDVAMTNGSNVVSTAYVFQNADVGKSIVIEGAGPGSGLPLGTTIASVAGGIATLAKAAESTVVGKVACERIGIVGNHMVAPEGSSVTAAGTLMVDLTVSGNLFQMNGGTVNLSNQTRLNYTGNNIVRGKCILSGAGPINASGSSFVPVEETGECLRVIAPMTTITGCHLVGANGTSLGVVRLDAAATDCVVSGNVIKTTAANAAWVGEGAGSDRNLIANNHLLSTSTGSVIVLSGPNSRQRGNHGTDGLTLSFPRRTITANYTVKQVDELIAVTSTSAERTITLPEASKAPKGQVYTIKDESGGAVTKNIKVVPKTPASEKIDGAESQTISANYGKVAVYSDGSNWFTA